MAKTETISARIDDETDRLLTELAEATQRSRSFLAAQAIKDFAIREAAIIGGIKQARACKRGSGKITPHDKVMSDIRKHIAKLQK